MFYINRKNENQVVVISRGSDVVTFTPMDDKGNFRFSNSAPRITVPTPEFKRDYVIN